MPVPAEEGINELCVCPGVSRISRHGENVCYTSRNEVKIGVGWGVRGWGLCVCVCVWGGGGLGGGILLESQIPSGRASVSVRVSDVTRLSRQLTASEQLNRFRSKLVWW